MALTARAGAVCLVALALMTLSLRQGRAETDTPPQDGRAAADRATQPEPILPAQPAAPAPDAAPVVATPPALVLDIAAAVARVPAKSVDARDRTGLMAAYEAREKAPIWMTAQGATKAATQLAAEIAKADDWGLKASAFDVPDLATLRGGDGEIAARDLADAEVRLSLALLKYARQARGGQVEPTALTKYLDRKPVTPDPRTVIEEGAAASDPAAYLRGLHPRHAEFERLRQRYLAVRDSAEPGKAEQAEMRRLLANMEQWRWMPDDLGAFHVTVNVPEQLIRVVRNGRVIHTERVVIGKTETQTPIFSDEMEQVIFHPFWGVPDSIKQNEVLPSLRGSGAVLAKNGLRIQSGGRDIVPATVDWTRTDIRKFHVYQPPGPSNVLGVVKFRFPNKHDVYMHDTPSKGLFKSAVRTFSHGCMRVQNPIRLAELVLEEDRRMTPEKVHALTLKDAPQDNQLNLSRRIPVHITYFTVSIDEAGKVSTFKDVYGHEERIALGLEGRFKQIKPVPEPKTPPSAEPLTPVFEVKYRPGDRSWTQNVFGGN